MSITRYLPALALTFFFTSGAAAQWEGREELLGNVEKTFGDPPGMTRLDKASRVWADKQTKRVVVDGYIALNEGQLEMFACPVATKEHESIVAVFSKAQFVHAGLLAVGAKAGTPVQWDPVYKEPTGTKIRVYVLWKDKDGNKQQTDAKRWIRELGTDDKTLQVDFVFAGSQFWKDPDTGEQRYLAESGDLICVSNFSTATLDVPIKSEKANSMLLFSAFTERIPEPGTPVRLVLQVLEAQAADENEDLQSLAPAQTESNATSLQETKTQRPENGGPQPIE